MSDALATRRALDRLVADFFGAVSFEPGQMPQLARLRELFVGPGLLVHQQGEPEVFSLEGFIASRRERFAAGTITRYRVVEQSSTTEAFGGVAQRASVFARSGVNAGQPFDLRGMIFFQCLRSGGAWKLSAVAWADQQPGQALASHPEPTEFG